MLAEPCPCPFGPALCHTNQRHPAPQALKIGCGACHGVSNFSQGVSCREALRSIHLLLRARLHPEPGLVSAPRCPLTHPCPGAKQGSHGHLGHKVRWDGEGGEVRTGVSNSLPEPESSFPSWASCPQSRRHQGAQHCTAPSSTQPGRGGGVPALCPLLSPFSSHPGPPTQQPLQIASHGAPGGLGRLRGPLPSIMGLLMGEPAAPARHNGALSAGPAPAPAQPRAQPRDTPGPPFPIPSELRQVPARAKPALSEPVSSGKEQQVGACQVSSPFPESGARGRRTAWETAQRGDARPRWDRAEGLLLSSGVTGTSRWDVPSDAFASLSGPCRSRWHPVPTEGRHPTAPWGAPRSHSPIPVPPKPTISPAELRGLSRSSPASPPGG